MGEVMALQQLARSEFRLCKLLLAAKILKIVLARCGNVGRFGNRCQNRRKRSYLSRHVGCEVQVANHPTFQAMKASALAGSLERL